VTIKIRSRLALVASPTAVTAIAGWTDDRR